ncbi:MAG: methyltransferase family protein [Actinomyces dentalis]|mgnify:FL=1
MAVRVPPVALAGLAALLQAGAPGRTPTPGSGLAAGALLAGSALLGGASVLAFGRRRTTVDPLHAGRASRLVVEGPYRLSRNPMYLAMAGALTAHAAWRRSPAGLIPVAAFVLVIDRVQIRTEETAMQALFGREYRDYRRRVRRWC